MLVNAPTSMVDPNSTGSLGGTLVPPSEIAQPWWKSILRWALPIAILVGLLAIAARSIDFRQFLAVLQLSDWRLVAAAGLLAVTVCMISCSVRLWLLIRPLPTPSAGIRFWSLTSVYVASCAAHHLLPAPAAEVLRTVHLKRRWGYSVGGLVAAQLVEKVIDALGLAIEILLVAAVAQLPRNLDRALYLFGTLTAAGVLAVLFVAWRHQRRGDAAPTVTDGARARVDGFLHRLGEGMYLLRSPRIWTVSIVCSFINDFANAATVGLAAAAVGVPLPISSWFIVVLVARLAGLLPSTPGQFGVVEAGLVLAMGALGIQPTQALAVAVLYHMAHFVPVTVVGLWELRRQWQEGS